jgi:hypothetical protein
MAAQQSLELLILVRIRAPLPVLFVMKSVVDEDPHLDCKTNTYTRNKPRVFYSFARCLLF